MAEIEQNELEILVQEIQDYLDSPVVIDGLGRYIYPERNWET